jgi:tetratricopeptide (TPR) repeat protein
MMLTGPAVKPRRFLPFLMLLLASLLFSCVTGGAISAEEYYAIGMAYFDLGKYADAEKWLSRASAVDKTRTASEYNLGRIAFETGRYDEALRFFNRILSQDPDNVLALRAAAYTQIKTGDFAQAEALYARVLALVPESADDGYNHALVLFALEQPERAEEILLRYQITLEDRADALLLLARLQGAQHRVEAVDTYEKWLRNNKDVQVRYEYAQALEEGEFYARALEEYRAVLSELPPSRAGSSSSSGPSSAAGSSSTTGSSTTGSQTAAGSSSTTGSPATTGSSSATGTQTATGSSSATGSQTATGSSSTTGSSATGSSAATGLGRAQVRYSIARLLLIADSESDEGIDELGLAITDGFTGTAALQSLVDDPRIPDSRKAEIQRFINTLNAIPEERPEGGNSETKVDANTDSPQE